MTVTLEHRVMLDDACQSDRGAAYSWPSLLLCRGGAKVGIVHRIGQRSVMGHTSSLHKYNNGAR